MRRRRRRRSWSWVLWEEGGSDGGFRSTSGMGKKKDEIRSAEAGAMAGAVAGSLRIGEMLSILS